MEGVVCAEQALKRIAADQIHFVMSEVYQQLPIPSALSDVRRENIS